jgi:ribosomal protein S18 acetylase RimI-like enzyme
MTASETDCLTVRPMTLPDLERALDWAAAEGWNPGLHDAASFHAADPAGFLLGELAGEPVGCIATVGYGPAYGSLGLYSVRPPFRGRGLGLAIWNAGLAYLGGRTVGLDAVAAQQGNYEKSGFRLAYRNVRYEGTGGGAVPAGVADLETVPFEDMLAYDRQCFPAARPDFLRGWVRPPGGAAFGVRRGDRLAGYGVLRPCRCGYKIGPLFADDASAADDLFRALAASAAGAAVFVDVPEANPAALALVRRHGLHEVFATARMYTNAAPRLSLRRIFGVTSLELG